MIQVRCPQCATVLAIKQAPPAGKLKCPKCSTVFAVGNSPASASARPAPSPRPPAASSSSREIDFRNILAQPVAPASGVFPVPGQRRVYDGPIELDPIPVLKTEEQETGQHPAAGAKPPANKDKKLKQKKVILGLVAGIISLLALGGGAFWCLGG